MPVELLTRQVLVLLVASYAVAASATARRDLLACSGRKGVVYDFFNQYCPSVLLTNSDRFVNFDAGLDSKCTDPNVYNKHQPMIWGSDRIQSGYTTIMAKPVRPAYVLTFNEPNYAYGGGNPTNINSPAQAAALWPNITSLFSPQGIQLLAPSAINCNYPGDSNCRYVGSITGWLNAFKSAIGAAAWNNIHGLSYHTYQQSFSAVQAELTSLHNTYGKPIWITEVAAGNSASVAQNQQLMIQLVQWAAGQPWIERVFWNQATPPSYNDPNVLNSYLVNKAASGAGSGNLTSLGQIWYQVPC